MSLRPPKLVKLIGLPVIAAAMFVVLGGHWAVLQAVAWSQMVVDYSRDTGSIATGLERTFSGQFPCRLCKKIAAAQSQEKERPAALKADKKIEVFVARAALGVAEPIGDDLTYLASADVRLASRRDPPPSPVPICA